MKGQQHKLTLPQNKFRNMYKDKKKFKIEVPFGDVQPFKSPVSLTPITCSYKQRTIIKKIL